MDTDMNDDPAEMSDYHSSEESDEGSSIHPSEWDTPPHERDANEAGGFSHQSTSLPSEASNQFGSSSHRHTSGPFADSSSDSDDDLAPPASARTLRYNRRSRSRNSSPGPFASEDVYEGDGVLHSVSPKLAPTSDIDSSSLPPRSPGLFFSENETAFILRGETTLSTPENVLHTVDGMEAMKCARDIKAEIEKNIAVLHPRDKAISKPKDNGLDPEDALINSLRNDQKLGWAEIAERLNNERRERDEAATFTSTSVYSRFVRLSAATPIPIGEMGFHPKDYVHLRQAMLSANGSHTSKGKKRVRNYNDPKELEVNMRKPVSEKEHDELETTERSEQLMQAVAKVERNFWVFVANEMERSTTRLYSPDALADRYHAI